MAGGYIDLFRKIWGWLAVDQGEAPPASDGPICIVAGGAFVIGLDCAQSSYLLEPVAGGAHTIGQDTPGDAHTIGATAGGHHIIGQDVKGTANCECC